MNLLDIIILGVMAVGLVCGLAKGFFKQLAGMVGLVAGLLVARALYGMVGEQMAPHIDTSVTVAQVIAFIAIWVLVPLLLNVIATLLTKVLKVMHLSLLNRFLGGMLGAAVSLLWIISAVRVIAYADTNEAFVTPQMKATSTCYGIVEELSNQFFPTVVQITTRIIENSDARE